MPDIIHFLDGVTVAAVVALGKYLFSLGTRVTVVETRHTDFNTLIETRFDSVDSRLERIERALNGKLAGH